MGNESNDKPITLGYATPAVEVGKKRPSRLLEVLVVVGIVSLLISILLPSLSRSKYSPNRVKCAQNLKVIGTQLLQYAAANRSAFPRSLDELLRDPNISLSGPDLVCPSTRQIPSTAPSAAALAMDLMIDPRKHLSYIYIGGNLRADMPGDTVLMYDSPENHDGNGMNVLTCDGAVQFFPTEPAKRIISELKSGHNPPRHEVVDY